jgi:murein DD-endopeptidase MepM/ murein hydrolase activator NlpD
VPRGVRAGLAALVLVVGAPALAVAQGPNTTNPSRSTKDQKAAVDRERTRLAERYDETLVVEADLVAAYEQSRAKATELSKKVASLDDYIVAVQHDLDKATAAANRALLRRDGLREDLRGAKAILQRRRSELRSTAVSGYVWFGERTTLHGAYGQAIDADQQLVSSFYAGYIDDVQHERVQAVEVAQSRVERLADQASAASAKSETARRAVAKQRTELQKARDQQATAKAAADAEVGRQRELVAQVEAKRSQYESRLRSLERESRQLGDLLRAYHARAAAKASAAAKPTTAPRPKPVARPASSRSTKPPPATHKPSPTTTHAPSPGPAPPTTNNAGSSRPPRIGVQLSYPLPGYPVVSKYGWRIHPILGVRKLHEGIDIGAPEGTPIHAAAPGTIVWAGPRNGYGNAVIIDHGHGVGTVYAHQSAVAVSAGQSVGRGAVIGYVGHTGLAITPHLHFEVRVGGRTYDPLAYVHPS